MYSDRRDFIRPRHRFASDAFKVPFLDLLVVVQFASFRSESRDVFMRLLNRGHRMILLLQENCCCSIAVVFFLVADSEHQGVATVLVWPISVLIFNCQLQEFLVVITLIGGVHLKFLSDTRTLEVLGLWTLHVLIYDVLELVFCRLRHLSSLFSHIDVL